MKFILLYFLIAMFIGFIIVYIFAPSQKVVIKYPTLENIKKLKFIDDNNVCYKYKKIIINCPK